MHQMLLNKPKVFLSHSKIDIAFIQRLYDDLRHCQIEPWLDSEEIRHGQPWLDAIFESGIPACDAILVYLTQNSIESPMVKKEIDASMIKKLKDKHIAFLPYISDAKLRDNLRADIQALQTPEWNERNYANILPHVVAEIWHSYLDRVVLSVANDEKVKRLEAELELERLKKTQEEGIFDAREVADFNYIWKQFDHYEVVDVLYIEYNGDTQREIARYKFRVNLQTIITNLDTFDEGDYLESYIRRMLLMIFKEYLPKEKKDTENIELSWKYLSHFLNELLMYGLLQRSQKTETRFDELRTIYYYVPSDKLYRFKYWLVHQGYTLSEVKYEVV